MQLLKETIQRLRAAAARLHEDRRGTSMTEFVITLPIFIILFEGIFVLGSLQRQAAETKVKAAMNMWNDAVTIQKTSIFSSWNDPDTLVHMHPTAAALEAANNEVRKLGPAGAFFSGLRNTGLSQGGHYGESDMLVDKTGLGAYPPAQPNSANDYYADASGHLKTNTFARRHVDDGIVNGQSSAFSSPSGLGSLTNSLSLDMTAGPIQSQGAGIRYGSAWGEEVNSTDVPMWGNVQMESAYTALAAPRSKGIEEEVISVGISRLGAEQRSELANVLGLF